MAKKKRLLVFILAIIALLIVVLWSVNTGTLKIFGGDFKDLDIIVDLRFPRIIISIIGGAGIAVSGALFQASMKNPLADPGLLGISAGASLTTTLAMAVFPSMFMAMPMFAFLGGIIAFILVYVLSRGGGFTPLKVILVGITINTVFISLIQCFNQETKSNLSFKNWNDVYMLLIYCGILFVVALIIASRCDLLALEDRTIVSLGVNVSKIRLGVSSVAVLLASICTAIVGPISFLGLIAPYIGRILVGNSHKYLIPFSMILGALLLLVADTIGRTIARPMEISAATLMAIIGGPCFILLLRRGVKLNEI